jgi:hypothetical protein
MAQQVGMDEWILIKLGCKPVALAFKVDDGPNLVGLVRRAEVGAVALSEKGNRERLCFNCGNPL